MRSDLSRACTRCAVRLPATLRRCPACGQFTALAADALERMDKRERKKKRKRAAPRPDRLRDGLLYVPAALGIVAAVVGAVGTAVALLLHPARDTSGGAEVLLAAMALPIMFSGLVVILACLWAPWALLVLAARSLAPHERTEWRLAVAPLAVPRRTGKKRSAEPDADDAGPWTKLKRSLDLRSKQIARSVIAAALALELVAELLSRRPFWAGRSALESAVLLGEVLFGQAIGFAAAIAMVRIAMQGVDRVFTRVEALWHAAPANERAASVQRLRRGEPPGGVAHLDGEALLVAPLSGESCLGFRIVGAVDGIQIDDAEVAPLVVDAGAGAVHVRPAPAVLALPEPHVRRQRLDAGARARVAAFLEARGLSGDLDHVALGEERLEDGAAVRIWGATAIERVGGSGYRDAGMHQLIDASDGLPVLIEPK